MALFKIEKGLATNLTKNRPNAKEGYAYFTTDDGKLYIDISGDGTSNTPNVLGTNRICLNAGKADEALRLTASKSIDGVNFNGGENIIHYGVCSTSASASEKIVNCSNFILTLGAKITVKFTVTNIAGNPTLNVNSTGAKSIYYRGNPINASYLAANRTYTFIYNGSQYDLIGDIDTNTTYYITSVICTTSASTAAKVGTTSYYNLSNNRYFTVMLSQGNTTASALTLNINGNGAKPIYINGSASSSSNYTLPAGLYQVYYNGSGYYFRTDNVIQGTITNANNSSYSTYSSLPYVNNDTSSKIYVLGSDGIGYSNIYRESSVYMSGNVLYGAAWNDYAEYRESIITNPGICIIEKGDDTLIQSTERLQPGASIISDTFGFAIGETDNCKTPIAVSGRVLAYPYESREEFKKNIGHPVCSGPYGTVSIMTDEEYREKGYLAIGTISAVPDYEEWGIGKVKVNGRIWIKIL